MVRTCFMKLNEPRKVSQTKNARTNDLALYELMIFLIYVLNFYFFKVKVYSKQNHILCC